MKRTDLIRKLEEAGCEFVRHAGNHGWVSKPEDPDPIRDPGWPTSLYDYFVRCGVDTL